MGQQKEGDSKKVIFYKHGKAMTCLLCCNPHHYISKIG